CEQLLDERPAAERARRRLGETSERGHAARVRRRPRGFRPQPPVLLAVERLVLLLCQRRDERLEEGGQSRRTAYVRLLVGDADLERAVVRVRPGVPPDACVIAPARRLLPVGPGAKHGRGAAGGQFAETVDPNGAKSRVLALEERRVRRVRDRRRQP